MKKRKIVFFWGDNKTPLGKLLERPARLFGKKERSYLKLFDMLSDSFDVYLVFGYKKHLGNLEFIEAINYNQGSPFLADEKVKADVVYDRSLKLKFPGVSPAEQEKVINSIRFKNFARDKWLFYLTFPQFCPRTQLISNQKELEITTRRLPEDSIKYVIKPVTGMKADGLVIGEKKVISRVKVEVPMILQEFIDTSSGIDNVVTGYHDLRCVVMAGEVVWATVRTPLDGQLMANVAKGGSIQEVDVKKLPSSINPIITTVTEYFTREYNDPMYSIDFGFQDGKPYIFEINCQMGIPLPDMPNTRFYEMFKKVALEKAAKK